MEIGLYIALYIFSNLLLSATLVAHPPIVLGEKWKEDKYKAVPKNDYVIIETYKWGVVEDEDNVLYMLCGFLFFPRFLVRRKRYGLEHDTTYQYRFKRKEFDDLMFAHGSLENVMVAIKHREQWELLKRQRDEFKENLYFHIINKDFPQ